MRVYVGTYTRMEPYARGRAEGIYILDLNQESGALALVDVVSGVANPSFLAMTRDRRMLFTVNEVPEIDGHSGGAVSAFSIDQATGRLELRNRQPSGGSDPCHVSVDAMGRFVFVANYGSGTVSAFGIEAAGNLSEPRVVHQHEGSGPSTDRQKGPHAHQIVPDPSNRFALANDLGTDQVFVYRIEGDGDLLVPHDPSAASMHPGAGPRHLAFHPGGTFVYVINELDSTLTACHWNAEQGVVRPVQTLSTLPEGFNGGNSCADVHIAPSGQFVYGSNRGHDSIVTFEIDQGSSEMRLVGHVTTGGSTPRSFAIDPSGRLMIVANQDSDSLVTFRIDPDTGIPAPTGHVVEVPSPVCIVIMGDTR